MDLLAAERAIARCREIARFSDNPPGITRTFLSPATHLCHAYLRSWMEELGLRVRTDAIGNLRGFTARGYSKRLLLGSHIDTVPDAGAFDGVLGVVLALTCLERLERPLPIDLEIIAFSEEEGVRFATPFLGSRAVIGDLTLTPAMHDAILAFGLHPDSLVDARLDPGVIGYFEFHIEQGPVLEATGLPLGVVMAIAGQTRLRARVLGAANHAGTTPMTLRRDALAGAAEWISGVEQIAKRTPGSVATVGCCTVSPGAGNVIPGAVELSLDVRHQTDELRNEVTSECLAFGEQVAAARGLSFDSEVTLAQPAVPMDPAMTAILQATTPFTLVSGAGHDAMILARAVPSAMLFLRSPGGISHHPDETVLVEDVAQAIEAGTRFLETFAHVHA